MRPQRFHFRLLAFCVLCLLLPAASLAQTPLAHERIAFVTADYDTRTMTLSIADPDGGNLLPLVVDGYFAYPTWSPDGTQLAFIGRVGEFDAPSLWLINADGTNLRLALPDARTTPHAQCAAWSPDGTRFVIGSENTASRIDLFTVNADGSNVERLRLMGLPSFAEGISGEVGDYCATWTPGGEALAMLANDVDFSGWQLWLWSLDGSGAVPFPGATIQRYSQRVAWSPDGQRAVVYAPFANDGAYPVDEFTVVSADGATQEAVIGPPARYPGSASWSPDSSRLAFVAVDTSGDPMPGGDIWIANADGSTIAPLNLGIDVSQLGTSWAAIPGDIVLPVASASLAEAAG